MILRQLTKEQAKVELKNIKYARTNTLKPNEGKPK